MAGNDDKTETQKETNETGKKNARIVRVNYCAYFAEEMKLFGTTDAEKAKEAGIYEEEAVYEPMYYIFGSNTLFPAFEKAIESAEIGKLTEVTIPCEEAAGARNPKLVETYRDREFHKQEINPYPGLRVTLGNRSGTVLTVGAGRVKVDFNSPLAGHDLVYKFIITEEVADGAEKAKAVIDSVFGNSDGFEFEITDDKVAVTLPDNIKFNQNWSIARFKVVSDLRSVFGVDRIEFIEIWATKKDKEEKAEEKPAEKKEASE